MINSKLFAIFSILLVTISCETDVKNEKFTTKTQIDANGYSYETVENDPTGLRLYTLENGLKVYLSKDSDEPKIQTFIPVRAGSVYDPKDNTGLAHYLEHMVFKGTDEIGAIDFEKEKVKLKEISDLYEKHKKEQDPEKKKEIYKQIDLVSHEASKMAIANEYDKMVGSLGAEGTNAWTWHEETVYVNKIPSNELDKWIALESERFSQLVLRLFHTELEAVYEEYNRGQDNDFRKSNKVLMEALFPKHPYGQQTTIGTSDHLKNPSMEAIQSYFDTYYVPNNMAVILVGDIDFDTTIKKLDASFGTYKYKEVSHPERPSEKPLTSVDVREVTGPESSKAVIAFRSEGIGSKEEKYLTLIDMILSNSQAGLIDLNLNQKQLVQSASSNTTFLNDYGMHRFNVVPKGGQSLEDARKLVLDQIQLVKDGAFDDWLIEAVINDMKLSQIQQYDNASAVAYAYVSAFVHFQDWKDRVKLIEDLKGITKEELVAFANEFYKDNYVVVNKLQGKSDNLVKVPKPEITPNDLNRDKSSKFLTTFNGLSSSELKPKFIDFDKAIAKHKLDNGMELSYIKNEKNDLAELYIIFDMGKDHMKHLPLAVGYLEYLGTSKYSSEDLKKEFYKLGVSYGVSAQEDESYVYLSGLRENIDKGLELLEELWTDAKPDQKTYDKFVGKIIKGRADKKANKGSIMWDGLMSYGIYGADSRLRNLYSISELKSMKPKFLVETVKDLKNYKHKIFYYGKEVNQAKTALAKSHIIPEVLKDYPVKKEYVNKETGNNVYFVDYDMVQAEMLFLSKGNTFDPEKLAAASLFNTYFGRGLSSIVFQEIRESKSLAYSAFSSYRSASEQGKPDYTYSYIGTQGNKLEDAVEAMLDLMNNMPEAQKQFASAKSATLKKIAAERINGESIYWAYESQKKKGFTKDNREAIYNAIEKMTMEDLRNFFNENIKGNEYNVMVMANKKDMNMEALHKLGKVTELDVDYLFNFEKEEKIKL